MTQGGLFDSAFDEYDEANPQVYRMFRHFTLEAIAAGRTRLGAKMVCERIRWDTMVGGSGAFTINNNFTAYYARKFEAEYPDHAGFFAQRKSKADEQ